MAKKLIELDNGLMMEVDVPQSEIEMISGGSDIVEKVGFISKRRVSFMER